MGGFKETITEKNSNEGQCQYFVVRKKRLCRMTVRPGRAWCGEHEPRPPAERDQTDNRVPCPYDPKHTCYTSKLEKHMKICNARPEELPPYIIPDVNVPLDTKLLDRRPLTEVPKETLLRVIDKINRLYAEHIEGNISTLPEQDIHPVVMPEFSEGLRAETSRRHLRQASALLRLAECSGLVADRTCYVELGAGKGQLSYYVSNAWCPPSSHSGVVLVDRAALRHKRDGKLTDRRVRIRADLRNLALVRLKELKEYDAVVGLAKHLCGVATDYALRCMSGAGGAVGGCVGVRGLVVATCCHHRCEGALYTGRTYLEELGITGEELNIILSVVSWATCGDGRARDARSPQAQGIRSHRHTMPPHHHTTQFQADDHNVESPLSEHCDVKCESCGDSVVLSEKSENSKENDSYRERDVSGTKQDYNKRRDSNISIKHNEVERLVQTKDQKTKFSSESDKNKEFYFEEKYQNIEKELDMKESNDSTDENPLRALESEVKDKDRLNLSLREREAVGRRAKALIDWGRVLYLRSEGMQAALCYYVPTAVSLENVCIVATSMKI